MAHIIADRIRETTTTEGTGTLALGGAPTGFNTFNFAMATADTCDYCIEGLNEDGSLSGQWEVGVGTYTDPDTLARTTVSASSNAGSLVNFSAGSKNVFLTFSASRVSEIPTITTGTWTPALEGATTPGTGTYSSKLGSYTKVGDLVFINCLLNWSAHTGEGVMRITGLPFPVSNTPAASVPMSIRVDSLTFTGVPVAVAATNTSRIDILTQATGAALTGITMDTSAFIGVSGCYRAA
jgi:hypothetical protein